MQRPSDVSHDDLRAEWADAFQYCAHGIALGSPADNTVLACNPAFARLVGRQVADVVGRPILSLYHPTARDVVRRSIVDADRAGQVTYEALLLRADGASVPVQMDVVSVRDAAGATLYRVATALDLSERHAAGQALRASEDRLRTVIEQMSEGLVLADLDGSMVHWNQAALAIHDFASMQEAMHPLRDFAETFVLATPEGRQVAYEDWPLVRLMRGEPVHDVELVVRRLDCSWERTLCYNGGVVTDAQGHRLMFVTITDVTERERLSAQLRQSQKLEALGQLAGGVAHDFNNIITVISGNAEMLAADLRAHPEAMTLVDELREAGARAATLTAQLLAFSRSQVLAPHAVDVNTLVLGTESMLRRLIGEDVRLLCSLSPGPCVVRIDPGQLEQVILNLVINARDAMPEGGTIRIETAPADPHTTGSGDSSPGSFVRLVVSDTGCGMAPDVKARIFEPFYTTKERGRGTGLGLATVSRIVAQSHGRIEVESAPGAGTAMTVYLPPDEAPAEHVRAGTGRRMARGLETILLVEDDEGVRRLARMALERQGYRVIVASDGSGAVTLDAALLAAVDLLVADLVMPGLGGRDVADALRALKPDLRVLFMSGYMADEQVRSTLAIEGSHFLCKPFEVTGLTDAVRQALDARRVS